MALRPRFVLANLTIIILAILATVFVFLTLTSKEWSVQKYFYNPSAPGDEFTYVTPLCVAHRSPFYRCGIPTIEIDDGTDQPNCTIPNCQFYRPYGWNRTSCSLQVETHQLSGPTNGVEQECQEVHWTGNLQIAATVFITLGLVLVLVLLLVSFIIGSSTGIPVSPPKTQKEDLPGGPEQQRPQPQVSRRSSLPDVISFLVQCSLYTGALLQVFAQFFGILGLTINATPTPSEARANSLDGLGVSEWIMDKALTRYATVGWTMALACAVATNLCYRAPKRVLTGS